MELPEFESPAMVPRSLKADFRQHSERCRILRSVSGDRSVWLKAFTLLLTNRLGLMTRLVGHYAEQLIDERQAELFEGDPVRQARLKQRAAFLRQRYNQFAGILDRYRQHMTAALKIIPHWDEETRQQAGALVASVSTALEKPIR